MKFENKGKWLKESDEDDNLLEDDALDIVDEELNEGLYVDPANYDKHSDLVDVVDKAGNPQKMTQDTYNKNKDSGEFKDAEPKEKEQVKAGSRADFDDLKAGNSYVSKEDIYYGDAQDIEDVYDINKLKEMGFVNKDNEIIFPAGTKLTYKGAMGGAEVFDINGEEFDMSLDDVELYNTVDSNIKQGYNADFAKELIDKFGKKDYEELMDLAYMTDDIEIDPEQFISDVKEYTKIPSNYIDKFMQMYNWEDAKQWKSALKSKSK